MQKPDLWIKYCADLLRAFNEQGVQYLLIGSMAKSHYSRQSRVRDIDLMINPTPENVRNVLSALRTVDNAADPAKLTDEIERKLVEGGKHMPLFQERNAEIFSPFAEQFDFRKAFSRSTEGSFLDMPVQVASMSDLKTLDSLREQSDKSKNG